MTDYRVNKKFQQHIARLGVLRNISDTEALRWGVSLALYMEKVRAAGERLYVFSPDGSLREVDLDGTEA